MYFRYFLSLLLCIAFISSALAQEDSLLNEEAQKIRISGIIITADSLREVTNTNIYVNDRLETYSSDTSGFFSLFAQPSDTITFTSLGYHQGKFIVPKGLAGQDYSLVQTLVPDTVILDEITIYPLPTAREFINAFRDSALIYNDKYEHMRENVERVDEMDDEEAFLSKYQPPEVNHGYGRLYNNRYGPIPGNNFLNPDRWRDFILDLQDYNFDGEGY